MLYKINQKAKFIIQSYADLSSPVKASFWFTICSILQKAISLLSIPIFTRILTTEQYGMYSVYQSWYDIVKLFATLNIYAAVFNNGMVKFEEDRDRFTSSLQGLTSTITIALFLLYIVSKNFWNNILGLPTLFVIVMFIDLIFSTSYSFWAARQRFDYKYKNLIIITLFIAIVSPILGIISVLLTKYKAEARVISFAMVQILVGLVIYSFILKRGKSFFVKKYWKYALAFNIPLIPHYLSLIVLQQSDRVMIGRLVSTEKAAIYSIAYSISTIMTVVTTAINNSLVPYTYKAIKDKKYSSLRNSVNSIILFVAIMCLLIMSFAPEVIKIFATKEYYEAIWIIPPVAASVYFMFLYPVFSNISFYFEENKFIMMASCIGAILNVILNYIFIPIFGYMAAGYTTLICYILFGVAHYFCYKRVVEKNIKCSNIYDIRFICLVSIFLLLGMCFILFIYKFTLLRYTLISLIVILIIVKQEYVINQIKNLKK